MWATESGAWQSVVSKKTCNCPGYAAGSICSELREQTARIGGQGVDDVPFCFLAVDRTERITVKSLAPASERKPPEIFCRSFIIRPSRSARLLVGSRGSVRKRIMSCLWVLRRSSRLSPTRRGGRPRGLILVSAGCASWNASALRGSRHGRHAAAAVASGAPSPPSRSRIVRRLRRSIGAGWTGIAAGRKDDEAAAENLRRLPLRGMGTSR
jgi:hypothetical protein